MESFYQQLPSCVFIIKAMRISATLKKIYPPELANSENLQRHVDLKFAPLAGYFDQIFQQHVQLSGSISDLLLLDGTVDKNTSEPLCQSDMNMLLNEGFIYTDRSDFKGRLRGKEIMVLDTTDCNPGFTRIKLVPKGEYLRPDLKAWGTSPECIQPMGSPAAESHSDYDYRQKLVTTYRCSSWHEQMTGIFKRKAQWPTEKLLDDLKRTPMYLINKADPKGKHANKSEYYRFSMSTPEELLCTSLPQYVRHMYLCCQIIVKLFCVDTALSSYHVKTCLFHFLSANFDNIKQLEVSLGLGVLLLINEVKQHFEEGRLEHFFNPDTNLLKQISSKKRKRIVRILIDILEHPEDKVLQVSKRVKMLDYRTRDQSLEIVNEAKDLMSQAITSTGDKKQLQQKAIRMLEEANKQTPIAGDLKLVLFTLVHMYMLAGQASDADDCLGSSDIWREEGTRREIVKVERNHSVLFADCISNALSTSDGPFYLHIDHYIQYVFMLFNSRKVPITFHPSIDELLKGMFFGQLRHYRLAVVSKDITSTCFPHYIVLFAMFFYLFDKYNPKLARWAANLHDQALKESGKQSRLICSRGKFRLTHEDKLFKQILSANNPFLLSMALSVLPNSM